MSAKHPHQPKYPIFIPSKGRADKLYTAKMFDECDVAYRVVVEPSQVAAYESWADSGRLLVLPEDDRGLVYARNWIKERSIAEGAERHWQFDDDVQQMRRVFRGHRFPMASNVALAIAEAFVDRYDNVALASFNSAFFVKCVYGVRDCGTMPPFYLNARCYTCFLVLNSLQNRWRRRYNEDTDMSLQVLADGWCTVLFNAFLIRTPETMSSKGGQTDIYVDDGRLRMARQLESMWPGTVSVSRRHGRPQHHIRHDWQRFDAPLKRKPGVVVGSGNDEFGMTLVGPIDQIKHPYLKKLTDDL